jgi:AraC-like DNA-binding protein
MFHLQYALFSGLLFFLGFSLIIRDVPRAFKFLGANFVFTAYVLFTTYLIYSGLMAKFPYFFKTGSPLMYLIGPAYYFFILYISQRGFKIRWIHLLHLLPFILHLMELAPFFILSSSEKAAVFLAYRNAELLNYSWGMIPYRFHSVIKAGLVFTYAFAGFIRIRTLFAGDMQAVSSPKRIVLLFLMLDVSLKVLTFGVIFLSYLFVKLFPENFYYVGDVLFFVDAVVCAFFLLLYPDIPEKSLLIPGNGDDVKQESNETAQEVDNTQSYVQEQEKESLEFKEGINRVFEDYFSDAGLNNSMIAKLMYMSERQLYRKAQRLTGHSPSELLLYFRIEKAAVFIKSDPERSIGDISKAIGFKSPSYFTRCFQRFFGLKPSEFQKSCKSEGPAAKNK